MKIKLLIIGIVGGLFFLTVAYDMKKTPLLPLATSTSEKTKSDPSIWESAPEVSFTALDGTAFTLKDFKGKVVLLNFWASWCPPCSIEFPSMLRLIEKFEGKIILVAVSNDEKESYVNKFLKRFEGEFQKELKSEFVHIVWDKDKHITNDIFNTVHFPETIIISTDTHMVKKIVSAIEWDGEEMTGFLNNLLTVHEE